jgi:hypothetical protein
MLATIVYAINPKQDTPVEGFTAYSPNAENAIKRRETLERDIAGTGYKNWSGEWRIGFIDRCKEHGWDIHVKNCMIG